MPLAKIDPIETWYSVGSSLIGRVLLFFSAGWFGLGLGQVASGFAEWSDFLKPWEALDEMFAGGLFAFVFWPITVFFLAKFPVLLIVALIGIGAAFFVFVYTEEPAPFWWLVVVAMASLGPVVGEGDQAFSVPSWIVLGIFWTGISFAAWWTLQKWHPEVVEKMTELARGENGQPQPSTPRRKAPPNTWGKAVEGWDGEDSADDKGDPES